MILLVIQQFMQQKLIRFRILNLIIQLNPLLLLSSILGCIFVESAVFAYFKGFLLIFIILQDIILDKEYLLNRFR